MSATQMICAWDLPANLAHAAGAAIIARQELFATPSNLDGGQRSVPPGACLAIADRISTRCCPR